MLHIRRQQHHLLQGLTQDRVSNVDQEDRLCLLNCNVRPHWCGAHHVYRIPGYVGIEVLYR